MSSPEGACEYELEDVEPLGELEGEEVELQELSSTSKDDEDSTEFQDSRDAHLDEDSVPILLPIISASSEDVTTADDRENIENFTNENVPILEREEDLGIAMLEEVEEEVSSIVRLPAPPIGQEVDVSSAIDTTVSLSKTQSSKGTKGRVRSFSALPDERYEKLLKCLEDDAMVMPNDPDYKHLHRLVHMNRLFVETRLDPAFSRVAKRIIDRQTNLIVPRMSEIQSILEYFFSTKGKPGARSLIGFANRYYCGVGKQHAVEFVSKEDRGYRKHAVHFRKTPRLIATRPMQHVEIDIVEMPSIVCRGSKVYNHILVVQCLFSRFALVKALPRPLKRDIVRKILIDIFSTFGPPEAYQTYTFGYIIDDCMPEVAEFFKIPVHCYGRNGLNSQVCSDHYVMKTKVIRKSHQLFGDLLHWVEVLSQVAMERNMKPHKFFSFKLSPFEVLYGRQPWAGNPRPPWIDPSDVRKGFVEDGVQNNSLSNAADEFGYASKELEPYGEEKGSYEKRSQCLQKLGYHTSEQNSIRTMAANLSGRKIQSGPTFVVGDRVYVRNPDYMGTGARRVLSGVVTEVVLSNKEWPYKVRFTDDTLDIGYVREEWFGPSEIAASTQELELVRKGYTNGKGPDLCQCSDMSCKRAKSGGCQFKLHRDCCRRMKNLKCNVHFKNAKSFLSSDSKRKRRIRRIAEQLEEALSSGSVKFRKWIKNSRAERREKQRKRQEGEGEGEDEGGEEEGEEGDPAEELGKVLASLIPTQKVKSAQKKKKRNKFQNEAKVVGETWRNVRRSSRRRGNGLSRLLELEKRSDREALKDIRGEIEKKKEPEVIRVSHRKRKLKQTSGTPMPAVEKKSTVATEEQRTISEEEEGEGEKVIPLASHAPSDQLAFSEEVVTPESFTPKENAVMYVEEENENGEVIMMPMVRPGQKV